MGSVEVGVAARSSRPSSPAASCEAVRKVMRSNRKKDTKPELALRRALYKSGVRFRKHYAIEVRAGRVVTDIAFPRKRVVVFVDGCFWHCCPIHGNKPRSNASYWWPKLAGNVHRDMQQNVALAEAGWRVIRVWEHTSVPRAVESVVSVLSNSA
jgi:DNA mismatch endonuclease (patch repair protein)